MKRYAIPFAESSESGLPDIPVSMSTIAELKAEEEGRRLAPLQAELVADELFKQNLLGVTEYDPFKKRLTDALVKPRIVSVATADGRRVDLLEAERMIRDQTGAWPKRPTPAWDPDAWISPPSAAEIQCIAAQLDSWDMAGKLKGDALKDRRSAILAYHKARMKTEHAGYLDPSGFEYAKRAELAE